MSLKSNHIQIFINKNVKQTIESYCFKNNISRKALLKEYLWHYIFNHNEFIECYNKLNCNYLINNHDVKDSITFYINPFFLNHLTSLNNLTERSNRSQFIYFIKLLYSFIENNSLPEFSVQAPYLLKSEFLLSLRKKDYVCETLNIIKYSKNNILNTSINEIKILLFLNEEGLNPKKDINAKLKRLHQASNIGFDTMFINNNIMLKFNYL